MDLERNNSDRRWYEGLGFQFVEEKPVYSLLLLWPTASGWVAAGGATGEPGW